MGRSVSVDESKRKTGSHGGQAHKDYPHKHAASEGSFNNSQEVPRNALVLHKQLPSTLGHGMRTGATGSPSFCSASASNSSVELAPQTTSRDTRSPSRSSQTDRFDSTTKSLFSSTGKAIKRHASKLSLASSISFDKDDEGKVVWKLSGLGAAEQEALQSSDRSKSWHSFLCIIP
jgi:hypothetical protein